MEVKDDEITKLKEIYEEYKKKEVGLNEKVKIYENENNEQFKSNEKLVNLNKELQNKIEEYE